jgi:hypothetical protein
MRFSEVLWEVVGSDGCFVDGKYGLEYTITICVS